MSCAVVVVAAGRGLRLGADLPKQYVPLNGPCALHRTLSTFLSVETIDWIQPVIHGDDQKLYEDAVRHSADERLQAPVPGGATRAETVLCGLEALLSKAPDRVLIHDAARPFVPVPVIESVIAALDNEDGACAALPVVDALWRSEMDRATDPIDRAHLWRAQTPQGFQFQPILDAHRVHDGTGADDVAVAREAGMTVRFVPGSERSYKITTQTDLDRALRDTA